MSKSTTFINYFIFLFLYITSFIVISVKNTEIVGFYFLFLVNSLCTLYNISYFFGIPVELNLIPRMISLSIIISSFLHVVSLIFIIMMLSNMRLKYSTTFNTPIKLPPVYRDQLETFKSLMITTFSTCSFLLIVFMVYFDMINFPFSEKMAKAADIIANTVPLLILILSFVPIIISIMQVYTANGFSIITRQQLMQ